MHLIWNPFIRNKLESMLYCVVFYFNHFSSSLSLLNFEMLNTDESNAHFYLKLILFLILSLTVDF